MYSRSVQPVIVVLESDFRFKKAPAWLLLSVCCLLFVTGCQKRTNRGTINIPPVISSPSTQPEAVESSPPTPVEVSPAPAPPPPAWLEADEHYARLDLTVACPKYRGLYSDFGSEWPREVAARAVIACAVGSPEERKQANEWLAQLISTHDGSAELQVRLQIFSLFIEEIQLQGRLLGEKDLKLKQLTRELENLKKIDARRRRP